MVEHHLHHLWFRASPEEPWQQYGFNCVQFGDHPAATIMSLTMEPAAQTYEEVAEDKSLPVEEVKQDSSKLLLDTYMDDGTTGGSPKQFSRMMGIKLESG